MNKPYCKCEDKGECIGCLIESKLIDPNALEEIIVKYYFGTDGLDYYQQNMSKYLFIPKEK